MKPTKNKEFKHIQTEEAKTWLLEDEAKRHEKLQREIVRYPYMAKLMGLGYLDTTSMTILDIGGGPVGLSSIIPCKKRKVIDPLTEEYAKYFDTYFHQSLQGEDLGQMFTNADLVIVTNALDHFENPWLFMQEMVRLAKPGSYFTHYHAINNAITHAHAAHVHNINPEWLHKLIDTDYETVWELTYPEIRYGWVHYNGKIGQPAFCGLYRKVTGYEGGE